MSVRWQQAVRNVPPLPVVEIAGGLRLTGGRFSRQPETGQEMVDSLAASDGRAGRYLDNTPEHPYIPYDAPSFRGRAHISSRSRMDETSSPWSPGGISDLIREHPIPFVMFAASAGILLAAWMGYRRYGIPSVSASRSRQTHTDQTHTGQTRVGWAMPDGSASHSDTITGEAADTLGQTHRENPSPSITSRTLRTDANPPIFDRP